LPCASKGCAGSGFTAGPEVRFGAHALAARLDAIEPGWRSAKLCVALSGGLDSTVLLHAAAALAKEVRSNLRAIHVDHGLQAASSAWADACAVVCRDAGVPLELLQLRLAPPRGASIEAAAREARYAALAPLLDESEWLLTAHHRDDQLETVLIQLLRGAGVAGLAAMPVRVAFGRGSHVRPLLDFDRAELAAYASHHRLEWIDDPMNLDAQFDRGWLRSRVLPAIRERWPSASATVARSASHLAEASRLLTEIGQADAVGIVDEGRLSLEGLARLSRDRQVNLVRGWLQKQGLRPPPAARLNAAMPAFLTAREDGAPALRWEAGEIRRYRGRLYASRPMPARAAEGPADAAGFMPLGPGLGRFGLVAGQAGGLPAGTAWTIRFRRGGESLRPHPGRPRKRLKDLCQEAGIVPWMRDRLPLVFAGERLAAVGDLWLDADLALPPGEPAFQPVWNERPQLY
jgi:tRNA(Ile)-lysidine synthase